MKEKEYRTIVFEENLTLTEAITRLITAAAKGEFVCGKFCGVTLYSDTVSFDSAFRQIAGQSYFDTLSISEGQDEEAIKRYNLMGQRIINPRLWEDWDSYVRSSVRGDYHGMDLTCALTIMNELLVNGQAAALAVLQTQTHTKTSLGLVLSIIRSFCKGGDDFVLYVTNYYHKHK